MAGRADGLSRSKMTHLRHWPPAKSSHVLNSRLPLPACIFYPLHVASADPWGRAMRRRDFITLLGGAVVLPRSGVAQQSSIPIIGFLTARSRDESTENVADFREGLREAGYRDGETVSIEFHWAAGEYDRLPALATDLVHRGVSVIVTSGGNLSAKAAKAATTTIPIVSLLTDDPVQDGLVSSLNQPGGNLTGVNFLTTSLEPIRLEFLHELVPNAPNIAMLVNPKSTLQAEIELRDVPAAARAIGLQVTAFRASNETTIDAAFMMIAEQGIKALLVASDTFFFGRRNQIVALAARYAIPAMYQLREFVKSGWPDELWYQSCRRISPTRCVHRRDT
jgi:putative tryptophan/tyrosine transport system substrate-binding protein